MILLVGGGEGMGPLGAVSKEINHAKLDAGLVIITGRIPSRFEILVEDTEF